VCAGAGGTWQQQDLYGVEPSDAETLESSDTDDDDLTKDEDTKYKDAKYEDTKYEDTKFEDTKYEVAKSEDNEDTEDEDTKHITEDTKHNETDNDTRDEDYFSDVIPQHSGRPVASPLAASVPPRRVPLVSHLATTLYHPPLHHTQCRVRVMILL
jgi:hypothetical protein